MSTPSFDQHLTTWKLSVSGRPHAPLPVEIQADSQEQFAQWQTRLAQVKIEANKAGYNCQFNKGGKSGRFAAWVVCNGFVLKVTYTAKAKRPQAVTETSREAYHSIDFETSRGVVALAIFDMTKANGKEDVTRKELEVWYKIPTNSVCGRVKELLDLSKKSAFMFGGKPYKLVRTEARLSRCDGASEVKNEGLKWVEVVEVPQFSQPERAQSLLFQ